MRATPTAALEEAAMTTERKAPTRIPGFEVLAIVTLDEAIRVLGLGDVPVPAPVPINSKG
jgi:hypothetical protein